MRRECVQANERAKAASNREKCRVDELERQVQELMKIVAQSDGSGGGAASVTNNITIDNRTTTINEGPTFVYNSWGSEDLSPLTHDAVQALYMSDATPHEMIAEGFALVCCDSRLKKNHVYYVPNKKDPDVVLVRIGGRWNAKAVSTAFTPTVQRIAKHLLDDQPGDTATADITRPKVEGLMPLENTRARTVPAQLATLMWKRLKPRAHGELSAEELRIARQPVAAAAGGTSDEGDDYDGLDSDFE